MNHRLSLAILLCAASAVWALAEPGDAAPWNARYPQQAHPAVVRVIVPGRDSTTSFGSGVLVAADQQQGMVLTNWHVVSEAAGQITVAFPDGFRSPARVVRTDRDWDLAALSIQRPNAQPVRLAMQAPRPGEPLTIIGYGSGRYREAAGRCTQYVSPGGGLPFEMVELSTSARQGDSGGPILNSRGELAGVLFGTGLGRTMGSYCGRVYRFLDTVGDDYRRVSPAPVMIANRPRVGSNRDGANMSRQPVPQPNPATDPLVAIGSPRYLPPDSSDSNPAWNAVPAEQEADTVAAAESEQTLGWEDVVGSTRADQFKTMLAAIGALAIFFHGVRLFNGAKAG